MADRTQDRIGAPGSLEELQRELAGALAPSSVEELQRQFAAALEQQAATAQILEVINHSRGDLEPVYQAVLDAAQRLLLADSAVLYRVIDGELEVAALGQGMRLPGRNVTDRNAVDRSTIAGQAALERRTIHVPDASKEPHLPQHAPWARLGVPIVRRDELVGVITVAHNEAVPFTPRQIALLETFAGQVGIAIENARLLNETKEALERQSAVSDVLGSISQSPGDIAPVLDMVMRRAMTLCDAHDVLVLEVSGEGVRPLGHVGPVPTGAPTTIRIADTPPAAARAVRERRTIHIPDLLEYPEDEYAVGRKWAAAGGVRTSLAVPLLRKGAAIGAIVLRRQEVRPFTDAQIALLETFADQAAIAIENVRLFNETREALERQTALGEILRVIAASPSDIQPVLDAIAASAARFCGAEDATVMIVRDAALYPTAHHGPLATIIERPMAPLDRSLPIESSSVSGRAVLEQRIVQVDDILTEAAAYPRTAERAQELGYRSMLAAPLMGDGRALGTILLRRAEPAPFTPKQVELLRTFADQAVIAMENVRLFNETKEGLEQQTAIAGILKVISSSPTDVQPVLDAIAESAARFCAAEDATVILVDGETLRTRAHHGPITLRTQLSMEFPLSRGTVTGRSIVEGRTVQVPDLQAESDDEYPIGKEQARRMGHRTTLATPLMREGVAIGAILLRRLEVRPFTDHQLDLVRSFADQAVIAIENVRLFNETKDALERQTAIAEILRVISSSPTDVQPVLEAVARSAARFCGAEDALVVLEREGELRAVAHAGQIPLPESMVYPIDRRSMTGHSFTEGVTLQVPDMLTEEVAATYPLGHALAREYGWRTAAVAPLLREGRSIGTLNLRRLEVRPFTDKQLELLQTFASQAVIAIENVRLFKETKEALERQTAISEILRVISSSPTDVQPVLDAIAESAMRFCAAEHAIVNLTDGSTIRPVAGHRSVLDPFPLDRTTVTGRSMVDVRTYSIRDLADAHHAAEFSLGHAQARRSGERAIVATPMVRDGHAIGGIVLWRTEPVEFTEKQIQLVETFARQAAIAIENVRLFNETKDALGQQTAVRQILEATTRSAFDVVPVMQTIAERAAVLCEAEHAWVGRYTASRDILLDAYSGPSEDVRARIGSVRTLPGRALGPPSAAPAPIDEVAHRAQWAATSASHFSDEDAHKRVGSIRGAYHYATWNVEDALADPELSQSEIRALTGMRAWLHVPLVKEGLYVGAINLGRSKPGRFSDAQVRLVETFADQAVIAIENVRLFHEIQDKSRQLEVASRHKSEFLANMSHELRTPLNAIIGFTDVMLEEMFGPLNDKQKEYLEDVRSSGTHLLTLINDILDLSKIEAGRIELEMAEFSFPEALENALTLVRERATRHGISLAADVAGDVGRINADERKVKQVLVNLLANAVKFTPDGGRVTVKARRADGEIEVAVHDTGIGVATEDQERIFDEFQQVGRDPERSREGTGLGLTLAKRFVELHGGRIWVESEVGKGSTFTFAIRVRQTDLAGANA